MINLEKEIREQPSVLANAVKNNEAVLDAIVDAAKKAGVSSVCFAARGTSDHACIYAQYIFGILAGIPCALCTPSVVSKYGAKINYKNALVIGVSQSGRAEDVIDVILQAKADGALTVALTNNESSPLAASADFHLFCGAGPEVSIAATKTFTSQMMLLGALAAKWAGNKEYLDNLANVVPGKVDELLDKTTPVIENVAKKYQNIPGAIVLGRGIAYPIALEGALKMLETNKLSMKGYALSDFHHGPIAQVKPRDLVIVISAKGAVTDDTEEMIGKLTNVGADILVITDDASDVPSHCSYIETPSTGSELTSTFMFVLVMQLLACKLTEIRGIDPDVAGVINKVTITK